MDTLVSIDISPAIQISTSPGTFLPCTTNYSILLFQHFLDSTSAWKPYPCLKMHSSQCFVFYSCFKNPQVIFSCGLCDTLSFTENDLVLVSLVGRPWNHAFVDVLVENKGSRREYKSSRGGLQWQQNHRDSHKKPHQQNSQLISKSSKVPCASMEKLPRGLYWDRKRDSQNRRLWRWVHCPNQRQAIRRAR